MRVDNSLFTYKFSQTANVLKLCLILFIFLPLNLLGQINIVNRSLTDPGMAILYVGFANELIISGIDVDSTYTVTSTNMEVKRSPWNKNEFWINPQKPIADTIKLYHDDKLLFKRVFLIKKVIGDIIPRLGNLTDSVATVKEVLKNNSLKVVIPDCYFDHRYSVMQFETDFYINNFKDTIFIGITYGNELTKTQIDIIKQMEPGEKIIFSRIKATCPDCVNRLLNPLTIIIR